MNAGLDERLVEVGPRRRSGRSEPAGFGNGERRSASTGSTSRRSQPINGGVVGILSRARDDDRWVVRLMLAPARPFYCSAVRCMRVYRRDAGPPTLTSAA